MMEKLYLVNKQDLAAAEGTAMSSVNIYDVARHAGVSFKTVSRVLNGSKNVRAATGRKVLDAVAHLNYRPNVAARRLAGQKSFLLGLIYDASDATSYNMGIHNGALRACRQNGFDLLLHPVSQESEMAFEAVNRFCRQSNIDGIIVTPPISENEQVKKIVASLNIASAHIAPADSGPGIRVCIDERRAAYEITALLLKHGHKHIGFVRGRPDHQSSHLRFAGYCDAMNDVGLEADEAMVEQGYYTFDSGYKAAERLFQLQTRPTAIMASDDSMAIGTMHFAHEHGLDIPRDLSVVGFDDETVSRYVWPPLTTVSQPVEEMGKVAVEQILSKLDAVLKVDKAAQDADCVTLEHKIIIRRSVARPVENQRSQDT